MSKRARGAARGPSAASWGPTLWAAQWVGLVFIVFVEVGEVLWEILLLLLLLHAAAAKGPFILT